LSFSLGRNPNSLAWHESSIKFSILSPSSPSYSALNPILKSSWKACVSSQMFSLLPHIHTAAVTKT
jgi:hypothetical protein